MEQYEQISLNKTIVFFTIFAYELQQQSGSLVPAAAVELWLRHLSGHPPLESPPLSRPDEGKELFFLNNQTVHHVHGVITLPSHIIAKEVNGSIVLLNTTTQDLIHLNQEASRLLVHMLKESSWSAILASSYLYKQASEANAQDDHAIYEFVAQLQQEGWVIPLNALPK